LRKLEAFVVFVAGSRKARLLDHPGRRALTPSGRHGRRQD